MKALLIVDIQNDFLPGGALAIRGGGEIIQTINTLMTKPFDLIVATKDWHPANHGSFAAIQGKLPGEHVLLDGADQILWPVHCVQRTQGAEFPPELHTERIGKIFYKGIDPQVDSYSAFFDNQHKRETGLQAYLKGFGVKSLYIAGLATDYCVKFTALDALKCGFQVYAVIDACRSVNLQPGDQQNAVHEMCENGAQIVFSEDLIKS